MRDTGVVKKAWVVNSLNQKSEYFSQEKGVSVSCN